MQLSVGIVGAIALAFASFVNGQTITYYTQPHCQGNIVNSYSVYDPVCLSTDAWYVQSFEVNGGIPGLPFCLHRDPIDPECKCSRQGISFITGTGCTNVTPLQKSYKVTPLSCPPDTCTD